jgi:hypothetical protein
MLAMMELDEANHPPNILFLRAIAVVALANLSAEKFDEVGFRNRLHNHAAAFDDVQRPWSI